jgi:hypothetical protein
MKTNAANEAYDDMLAGRNIRGVVIYEPLSALSSGCERAQLHTISPRVARQTRTLAEVRQLAIAAR